MMAKARKKTSAEIKADKTDITANWASLTWNDLERWSDSRSVQRGRIYQKQGRVSDMGITSDGQLLATVAGTQRYVVSVALTQHRKNADKPKSQCTCPVGASGCKHAVAVVVDLLEKLADGHTISTVSLTDRRWDILAYEDVDAEDVLDDLLDNAQQAFVSVKTSDKTTPLDQVLPRTQWNEKINAYIGQKSHHELTTFMMTLVERFPELREEFVERILLEQGSGDQLLKETRKEMRRVTKEVGWQNHWNREGYTPDYSKLKHKLERLVEMGYSNQVVALGRQLLGRGMQQIEQSDDEGETAAELSECLVVVFDALFHTSLSTADKINYVIDACLQDGYEVIGDAIDPVLASGQPQDWATVANRLRAQLDELPAGNKRSDFSQTYHRDRVSDWLLRALEHAGQKDALQSVYEAEARATCSYQRLVSYLLEKGDDEAVHRWACEGIEQTREKWPGIAASLAGSLCELARLKKQWNLVASHAAYAFFDRPDRQTFNNLLTDARKAKCVRQVQAMAISFLETGQSPIKVTRDRNDHVKLTLDAAWPLPVPEYLQTLWPKESQQPYWDVLLDMAIAAKRPKDVLNWFDRMTDEVQTKCQPWVGLDWHGRVADAVAQSHPQRAFTIRQQQLEAILPQTGVRAYESTAACLRKIKPLLVSLNRSDECDQLLVDIRKKYKNRPRFMEILDRFDEQTILLARKTRRTVR